MLLTDTDSLKYKIQARNVLKTSKKIKSCLNSVIYQNFKNCLITVITYS